MRCGHLVESCGSVLSLSALTATFSPTVTDLESWIYSAIHWLIITRLRLLAGVSAYSSWP